MACCMETRRWPPCCADPPTLRPLLRWLTCKETWSRARALSLIISPRNLQKRCAPKERQMRRNSPFAPSRSRAGAIGAKRGTGPRRHRAAQDTTAAPPFAAIGEDEASLPHLLQLRPHRGKRERRRRPRCAGPGPGPRSQRASGRKRERGTRRCLTPCPVHAPRCTAGRPNPRAGPRKFPWRKSRAPPPAPPRFALESLRSHEPNAVAFVSFAFRCSL